MMKQEEVQKHIDHLKGVVRQSNKDGGPGYGHFLRAIGIAFQAVAPGNKDIQQLARALNKTRFDEDGDVQDESVKQAEQVQQQAGQLAQNRSQPGADAKGQPQAGSPLRQQA